MGKAKTKPLPPEALLRRCKPEDLGFETTDELSDLDELLGQDRAVEALRFAIGMRRDGYNLFALGDSGTGRHEVVRRFLREKAKSESRPSDWCYVNNFVNSDKPNALRLPPGLGVGLRDDVKRLIEDLKVAIPAAFESEDYQNRKQAITEEFKSRQADVFKVIQSDAEAKHLAIMRTPVGLIFLPEREGEVLSPEAFAELPEEERKRVEADIEALQTRLQDSLRQAPQWEKERHEHLRELNKQVTAIAVQGLIKALRERYAELPEVMTFLGAVETDIVDNVDQFLENVQRARGEDRQMPAPMASLRAALKESEGWRKYEVNVLVDSSQVEGAAVVYEDNPTLANLVGRVDHRSVFGLMTTDFSLIRPGALHKANGGYLMLDALRVLQNALAWEELKRALRSKEIRIESPGQILSLVSTVSLEPDPIPLDVHVLLVGERWLYYLLSAVDPEFPQLFKVAADFATRLDRDHNDALQRYARLVATKVREEKLRPFAKDAVARIIERSGRLVDDAEKLSVHMESLIDLVREADYWAGQAEHEVVGANDVQKALDAQVYRESRLRDQIQEETLRGTLRIATEGAALGQINGLSVWQIGRFAFGRPTRITARVHLGKGDVVDIEREVKLGGPIHSKGVLILSAFLGARYAQKHPLTLSASLVFEQSYGGVEGDSASMAELCALLSAIAEVPLRQDLAMTGSVDQHGLSQAVGGVNEKIEGFFDICKARGLTGHQGVVLPAANQKHLMLREDVVQAAAEGRFSIYTIESVDEAVALLTGMRAGKPDAEGVYPEGTFNRRVADRLEALAEAVKEFAKEAKGSDEEK